MRNSLFLKLSALCFAFISAIGAAGNNVERFTVNGVTFEMAKVEGGKLKRTTWAFDSNGSVKRDAQGNIMEIVEYDPISTFYIGTTEVTQALWEAVMGENPSDRKTRGANLPVNNVSWLKCQKFIEKLNQLTGQQFRMPSWKEWLFAAKGGNLTHDYRFPGTNDWEKAGWIHLNGDGVDGYEYTHPVAQKLPNELGLYDMLGNVEEWTSDPATGVDNDMRKLMGGDWLGSYDGASKMDKMNIAQFNTIGSENFDRMSAGLRLALTSPVKNSRTSGSTGSVSKPTPTPSANSVLTFKVKGVTFEMVKVEGGSFQMGSNDGAASEKPVHRETVATFYIGRTEVTQQLWQAVMGDNPSEVKGNSLPVSSIYWSECQEFIKRLNKLTGKQFRLPTEAEWEYAARGGNSSQGYKYSGSNDPNSVAWYPANSGGKLHPVGQKQANELGIYDMSGNVFEITADNWRANYSAPRDSERQAVRGGAYNWSEDYSKVTNRDMSFYHNGVNFVIGFRLALQ